MDKFIHWAPALLRFVCAYAGDTKTPGFSAENTGAGYNYYFYHNIFILNLGFTFL